MPGDIINLRRTNLVHMALSKMQHGLGVKQRAVALGLSRVLLDFDMLLDTIQHYCIEDQEWASLTAYSSTNASSILFLTYEDFVRQPDLTRAELLTLFPSQAHGPLSAVLQLRHMSWVINFAYIAGMPTATTKGHSTNLCLDEVARCDVEVPSV